MSRQMQIHMVLQSLVLMSLAMTRMVLPITDNGNDDDDDDNGNADDGDALFSRENP